MDASAARHVRWLLAVFLVASAVTSARGDTYPQLTDDRLELTLFAEEPGIVTPIGMAIDRDDRIFVIESHTHLPPADYAGPASDRIKLFVDNDGDGRAVRPSIFADGLREAMNLAFSPSGELYVVCAREVLRLVDDDRDGVCDRKDRVLALVTTERYAHNSLLGIAFDREEWMYVARGNVGSHFYRFLGTDNSSVEGYGDGGNVIRCRPDGTELAELATGFWNPFALTFDRNGRLLLVDNDPDARGPNRLVHVVDGGDYGYKSVYGGGGNHPFQGWDGSLPGTLPFVAATGEAPSGLFDCRRSSLPNDYGRSFLVTVWNENSIERFDVVPEGTSLGVSKKSVFISGPQNFRPVAIDADSRGDVYITDWVLVDYPNHGRGRIWRVSCRDEQQRLSPQRYFAPYLPSDSENERIALTTTSDERTLRSSLESSDPFIRHAAQRRLAAREVEQLRDRWLDDANARVRLGALLSSKSAQPAETEVLAKLLADPDTEVRRAALMWAGESLQAALRPYLELALQQDPVDARLFETYLAAVQNLDPDFVAAFRSRASRRANQLPRRLDPALLFGVARDPRYTAEVRGLAIRRFDDATVVENGPWLLEQLRSPNEQLVLATIRRLGDLDGARVDGLVRTLSDVALDQALPTPVRCEALGLLAETGIVDSLPFLPLLESADTSIAIEAGRTFRAWLDAGIAGDAAAKIRGMALASEVRERLSYALGGTLLGSDVRTPRPGSIEAWREALATGGDPGRGRRVFLTSRVGCAKCHTLDGLGGILGPDLSRVAQSKSRRQIADAILDPSADFPPQYQAWVVVTTDGRIHRGLQLDHKAAGAIAMLTEDGTSAYFEAQEIEAYEASPTSLMPAGLADTLSVGEFRDLVAFLETLR